MSDFGINNPSPVVVEAFTSAAITTLQELIGVEAHFEQCQLDGEVEVDESIVVAVIQLLREIPGSMFLILTPETASQIAAKYLPIGAALTEEIIDDVAGEFANVIAGQAKTILKGTTSHFQLSTPTINRAKGFDFLLRHNPQMLVTLLAPSLGHIRLALELPNGAEISGS